MMNYTYMEQVDSSSINCIYYDHPTLTLFVEFHNNSVAGYGEVDAATVFNLANAQSVGKFYNQSIRGKYKDVNASGEFVKRPALSVVPSASSRPVNTSVERAYTVRGYVLVEKTYIAASLDAAVQLFNSNYKEVSVKEVVVSFDD